MLRGTTARSLPATHRPSRTPSVSSECLILPASIATLFFSFVIDWMPRAFEDGDSGDGRYRTAARPDCHCVPPCNRLAWSISSIENGRGIQ